MMVCAWDCLKLKSAVDAETFFCVDANVGYHWHLFLCTCPNACTLGSRLCDPYPAEIMEFRTAMQTKENTCSALFSWLTCMFVFVCGIFPLHSSNSCTSLLKQSILYFLGNTVMCIAVLKRKFFWHGLFKNKYNDNKGITRSTNKY